MCILGLTNVNNYKALSDIALVDLLKQNDEKALSALYLRYWDKLLSVACNRLKEPETAEEVVQDIFFSLWKHRNTLQLKHSLSSYLAVAVKYRVIDAMRRRYQKRNHELQRSDYEEASSPSAEVSVFEQELKEQIEGTIKRLPEKCQMVFRMSREQGLTYKQISAELDISEKTVETHISKALKDLRTNLNTVAVPMAIIFLIEQAGSK